MSVYNSSYIEKVTRVRSVGLAWKLANYHTN